MRQPKNEGEETASAVLAVAMVNFLVVLAQLQRRPRVSVPRLPQRAGVDFAKVVDIILPPQRSDNSAKGESEGAGDSCCPQLVVELRTNSFVLREQLDASWPVPCSCSGRRCLPTSSHEPPTCASSARHPLAPRSASSLG